MSEGAGEETTCPKCGTEQPPGDACRRCGLVYAKWQGREPDPYEGVAGELWEKCVGNWDHAPTHDQLLLFCRREGSLSFAAARYRAVLKERPDDPVATGRLKELVKLAEFAAQAEIAKARPTKKSGRGPAQSVGVLIFGLLVLAAAAAALYFFVRRR